LPVIDIAFARGFSSLRRFNDAFSTRYAMLPTRLRKKVVEDASAVNDSGTSILQLLAPVLPALLNRLRDLFDLNARPEIIARHLARDKVLGPSVKANPGLRVPGAFNGFELALRAWRPWRSYAVLHIWRMGDSDHP
jgi:3-methyladenine DNA glycosylase/8-oxoguanine DNA glycosylase